MANEFINRRPTAVHILIMALNVNIGIGPISNIMLIIEAKFYLHDD